MQNIYIYFFFRLVYTYIYYIFSWSWQTRKLFWCSQSNGFEYFISVILCVPLFMKNCLVPFQAVGWLWGYYVQDFHMTVLTLGAGFILACLVSSGYAVGFNLLVDWSSKITCMPNRHSLIWTHSGSYNVNKGKIYTFSCIYIFIHLFDNYYLLCEAEYSLKIWVSGKYAWMCICCLYPIHKV